MEEENSPGDASKNIKLISLFTMKIFRFLLSVETKMAIIA